VVCGHGMLQLGDDSHAMEALGCSAAEEGGWHGGRNGRRGAAKLGLVAAPIMEEREWGVRLVATQREGWRGEGPVSVGGAARAWSVTVMTRARRHRVTRGRGRGRERRERAGEAGEWGRLRVGPY
jgi:hypothetical protein